MEEKVNDDTKTAAPSNFLEALYGDPLRVETTRAGRNLIIVSTICIATIVFKAKLQPTNLLPVDFGARDDALQMLLSAANILLLVNFLSRAATDVLRDWETSLLVTRYIEGERLAAARKAANEIDTDIFGHQDEGDDGYEPEPWWEDVSTVREAATKAVSKAEKRIGIRRWPKTLRRIRVWAEIGAPTVLGILALILSAPYLQVFIVALYSML